MKRMTGNILLITVLFIWGTICGLDAAFPDTK